MIADRSFSGASEAFWNKVESFDKRADAQLAKDVTIALPIELTVEQNIALARDFVATHITAKGMVADWVYHDAPRNPHVHLMTSLRPLTEDGFGAKKVAVLARDGKPLRNDAGKIVYEHWAGSADDFNAFRDGWFECHNLHLAPAGLDIHIDGRSYEKQGIRIAPTIHFGVGATAIERKPADATRPGYARAERASGGAPRLASLSLDRHLTYVAMTRHREDLVVYYGGSSFAKSGGLVPILSRQNAKETTLDYEEGSLYRQASRFAEARGLHLMNVARTIVRDRLDWTVRRKQKLSDLGARLAAVATAFGLTKHSTPITVKEAEPMVWGMTNFARSIEQVVEDRLAADLGLQKQWHDVSARFELVYAKPEAAFAAVNVDGMTMDKALAATTVSKIAAEPESDTALVKALALPRNLERYLRSRAEAERRHEVEKRAVRLKLSLDIPALSLNAKQTLERVRDAIDRNDLPVGLEYAQADKIVGAELEGFARAVAERFGERTFLGLAARGPDGEAFRSITSGMTPAQAVEVQTAWNSMRTVQQLSAHERAAEALRQSDTLRQAQTKGLGLK